MGDAILVEDDVLLKIREAHKQIEKGVPASGSEAVKIADRKTVRAAADNMRDYNVILIGVIKELRNQLKNGVQAEGARSYAAAVKKAPVEVVVENSDKQVTPEKIFQQIKQSVNPVQDMIGITGMKVGRNGAVIVKCVEKDDAEKFKKSLRQGKSGLSAIDVPRPLPKLVLFGMDKGRESEDILETICTQNNFPEDDEPRWTAIKELFRYPAKQGNAENIVFEVTPDIRRQLSRPINFEFRRVYFKDFISALQCFKCYSYGHKSSDCKEKNQLCGECAGVHHIKECPKQETRCAACVRINENRNQEDRVDELHHAKAGICTAKKIYIERAAARVQR